MGPTDFAYHLSNFFKSYLPGTLGLREKSIQSYQSAVYTFLKFMKESKNIKPEKITVDTFSVQLLMEYLQYLEGCGNSVSTRNHRLTVLRSFFQYVQLVDPKQMYLMQQLLSLKRKRQPQPVVNYLSVDGIKLLLSTPNASTCHGYRDMLLLSVLYETGARVSELTNMTVGDIRFEKPATVVLHGKNGKSRIVPLAQKAADMLRRYLEHENLLRAGCDKNMVFTNASHGKLTNAGVTHILKKHADTARVQNATLIPSTLSPHCLRHSKAMHLLQSGVHLIYIRDFLGHSSIKTTEVYAKLDGEQKRKAIETAYTDLPDDSGFQGDWNHNLPLMRWLKETCG